MKHTPRDIIDDLMSRTVRVKCMGCGELYRSIQLENSDHYVCDICGKRTLVHILEGDNNGDDHKGR